MIALLAIAWPLVALVVGLGIGRAIKLADQRSTCCPLHPADES